MATAKTKSTPFAHLWQKAVDEYVKQMRDLGVSIKEPPCFVDVDALIAHIGIRHKDFDKDTDRGKTFTKGLELTLQPFTFLNSMFGGAAGVAFPPSSQILGAVSVLIDAGKRVADAFDAVDGLFQSLGAFTQRLRPLTRQREQLPEEFESILSAILVSMLGLCALATQRTYHPEKAVVKHATFHKALGALKMNTAEYLRQLFLGKDQAIDDKVGELRRLIEEEEKMTIALIKEDTTVIRRVAVNTEGLSVEIKDIATEIRLIVTETGITVEEIRADVKSMKMTVKATDSKADLLLLGQHDMDANMKTRFDRLEKILRPEVAGVTSQTVVNKSKTGATQQMKDSRRLMEVLKPAIANVDAYNQMKSERLPGTGDWITGNDVIKQWLDGPLNVTWLEGDAGTGKSFLATRIVEELLALHKQGVQDPSRISVAYFFCRNRINELKDSRNMLRTLAFQIAQNDQAYRKYIFDQAQIHNFEDEDFKFLWKLLFTRYFTDTGSSAYLVVDAVDECETSTDEVHGAFSKLAMDWKEDQHRKLKLKLLFSNKLLTVDNLGEKFGTCHPHVALSDCWNEADLLRFVRERTRRAWTGKLVSTNLHKDVEAAISSQLHQPNLRGNYLWAALVIEELTSLSRESSIRHALLHLPQDIESAMVLVLSRLSRDLSQQDLEDLNDILAWVECGRMLLSVRELDALLCIREPEGARVVDLLERLKEQFVSLFVLASADNAPDRTMRDRLRQRLSGNIHETEGVWAIDDHASVANVDIQPNQTTIRATTTVRTDEDLDSTYQQSLDEMANLTVTLGHSLVGSFIQNRKVQEGVTGFATDQMFVKVLRFSLDALCDTQASHDEQTIKTAFFYIAQYLPHHVITVPVDEVDAAAKVHVAERLIQLLRDEAINYRWILHAETTLLHDLIDDDDFVNAVDAWLTDVEVLQQLPLGQREWVESAQQTSASEVYLKQSAISYGRRWLTMRTGSIAAQFGFLDGYLNKLALKMHLDVGDSHEFASDASVRVGSDGAERLETDAPPSQAILTYAADTEDDIRQAAKQGASPELMEVNNEDGLLSQPLGALSRLEQASAQRILQVARWAGLDENALWHSRVAFALRFASQYEASVESFELAMKFDSKNGPITAGLAITYFSQNKVDLAIDVMKQAVDLYESNVAAGMTTDDPDKDMRTYCLWDTQELANYYSIQDKPLEAIKTHESIIIDWERAAEDPMWDEITFSAIAIVTNAGESGDHETAMTMLERMVQHPKASDVHFAFVYQHFLESVRRLDRAAFETKRFSVLDRFWRQAFEVLARWGEDGQTAAVRYFWAQSILHMQPSRVEEAVGLLRNVVSDVEISFKGNTWHWLKERAEMELARIYLNRAIVAREEDRWHEVGMYANELVSLCRQDVEGDSKLSVSTRDCTLILAAWDRINGRVARAKHYTKGIMEIGIDTLSDSDPQNDLWGWIQLADCTLVAGDIERAVTINGFLAQIIAFDNSTTDAEDGEEVLNNREADTASSFIEPEANLGAERGGKDEESQAAAKEGNGVAGESFVLSKGIEYVSADKKPTVTDPSTDEAGLKNTTSEGLAKVELANDSNVVTSQDPILQDLKDIEQNVSKIEMILGEIEDESESTFYTCDGPCFEDISSKGVIWRCSYCVQEFCTGCHELISEKKAQWATCNSMHVRVPLLGSTERWPKGKLKVGADFVEFQAWLEELKVDWKLREEPIVTQKAAGDETAETNADAAKST